MRRIHPALMMFAGVVATAVAATTLIGQRSPVSASATGAGRGRGTADATTPAVSGVTIGGPSDVAAQTATYAPGQSSGWHAHTGLHAVVVRSGTLTVYDAECRRHTYGPGESYVGGRETHLAVNETDLPVDMAVTYVFPAGVTHTGFHIPAAPPAGCTVS